MPYSTNPSHNSEKKAPSDFLFADLCEAQFKNSTLKKVPLPSFMAKAYSNAPVTVKTEHVPLLP
jgi:hypothetical protein